MIGLKTKYDFHLHNCPHQEIRISFPLFFLELLKQNTINSLMILQNLFTSGKFLGNMEITGVD